LARLSTDLAFVQRRSGENFLDAYFIDYRQPLHQYPGSLALRYDGLLNTKPWLVYAASFHPEFRLAAVAIKRPAAAWKSKGANRKIVRKCLLSSDSESFPCQSLYFPRLDADWSRYKPGHNYISLDGQES
jgi:hypothetical protein